MVTLASLWLPILVSAVVVFIASAIVWMVLPHHKTEWQKLPDEEGLLGSIRGSAAPGQYMFPHCMPADLKDPATKQRYEAGPHGVLTVWPGAPSMGRNLGLTFTFYLAVAIFVAYVASIALPSGTHYGQVFRVTSVAAVMAHVFGFIPDAIWFGRPLVSTCKSAADGVLYSLLTGGVFGWLWPAVA